MEGFFAQDWDFPSFADADADADAGRGRGRGREVRTRRLDQWNAKRGSALLGAPGRVS
ncbi:MAG: hypothetical protein H7201_14975 [Candidatus Saccharibacteria bacterium]|nr:hypothetical protein [Microbacteriaceae bacterium]